MKKKIISKPIIIKLKIDYNCMGNRDYCDPIKYYRCKNVKKCVDSTLIKLRQEVKKNG